MPAPCRGPAAPSDPGPTCGRPGYARGLCVGHYRLFLAGGDAALRPLTRAARGTGGRTLGIRADQGLITEMRVAADEDRIAEPEAWRRAAREWLERRPKRK